MALPAEPPPCDAPGPQGAVTRARREWIDALQRTVRRDLPDLPRNSRLWQSLQALFDGKDHFRPTSMADLGRPYGDIVDLVRRVDDCHRRRQHWEGQRETALAHADRQAFPRHVIEELKLRFGEGDLALRHEWPDRLEPVMASIRRTLGTIGEGDWARALRATPHPPDPAYLRQVTGRLRDVAALAEAMTPDDGDVLLARLERIHDVVTMLDRLQPPDYERRIEELSMDVRETGLEAIERSPIQMRPRRSPAGFPPCPDTGAPAEPRTSIRAG